MVMWDASNHRHLSFGEFLRQMTAESSAPDIVTSSFVPPGQAYIFNSALLDSPLNQYGGMRIIISDTSSADPIDIGRNLAKAAEEELAEWWRDKAEAEIDQTVAKAIEYGSTDLIDIGRDLARIAKREVSDEEAAEMGIYFYLLGKLSRWRSAIERGDRPSDDTLLDIGVYVRMAQRVRSHGGWPGTESK